MAHDYTPHFHNTPGVERVRIGAKEFMCMGALPPFDHPHEFLDMGGDSEAICPYCSTVFEYDATLDPHEAEPRACMTARETALGQTA